MSKTKHDPNSRESDSSSVENSIILFNDQVNEFKFIVDVLVHTCRHEPEQAEQCALIAHMKGKCNVKSGDYETLKPICEDMSKLGLTVEIE